MGNMAKLEYKTISRRAVEALRVEKDTVFWDNELTGFGIRVYPSGSKVYVAQTRAWGKSKRVMIGRHGVLTAEQARRRAALIIARVKAGEEPIAAPIVSRVDAGPTIADLAARYLEEHVSIRCTLSTARTYRQTVNKHIVPELGELAITAVGRNHILDLHYKLHATPYMANRVVEVLSRLFSMAETWGLVPEGINPCRLVVKYKKRKRERFLTEAEFRRLGWALTEAASLGMISAPAVAAIRLLTLTGCRTGEILTLRWEDVDLAAGELRLADSKMDPRTVLLSPAASRVLANLPRVPGNPWVIPGRPKGSRIKTLHGPWDIVRTRAGLDGVRLHDLRHSFASRALALGESLPVIGKLLGHSQIQTTARYAHLARDSMKASASRVAASIGADLLGDKPGHTRAEIPNGTPSAGRGDLPRTRTAPTG